ncbi:glycosyltransferase family 4 protein [bacterium]|nr:glycosyltransferase family 4 protein [bacterium]
MKNILIVATSYKGGEKTHIDFLIKYLHSDFNFFLISSNLTSFFKIYKLIKDQKIDLIHCHGLKAAFFVRLLKLFCYCFAKKLPPLIVTIHGFHYARYKNFLKKMFFLYLERMFSKLQDFTIAVSEDDKELILKYRCADPQKIGVIVNGVDLTYQSGVPLEAEQELNDRKIDTEKDILIYGIGVLELVKGWSIVLKAAKEVCQKNDKVKFLIFGQGSLKQKMKQEIVTAGLQEKFFLMGKRNNMRDWLKLSSVYVGASAYEAGLSFVMMEAMAERVPLIVSDGDGYSVIKDRREVYIFKRDDDQELARKILYLISDKEVQQQFKKHSWDLLCSKYDVKEMVAKTKQVYSKVV